MREICAASDFDFVAAEPRRASESGQRARRKTGARPTPNGQAGKGRLGSAFARLRAMGRYVTPVAWRRGAGRPAGAVVVNAMFLQHGRHPAPLLGSTIRIEPPKPCASGDDGAC